MRWEQSKTAQLLQQNPRRFPCDEKAMGKAYFHSVEWEAVSEWEFLCFGASHLGVTLWGEKINSKTEYNQAFMVGDKNIKELWGFLQTAEGQNHVKGGYKLGEFIKFSALEILKQER